MSRSLRVAFLLVTVIVASGCDHTSSFAPSAVSSSPLASPSRSTGATITGTVEVATSAQPAQFSGRFAAAAPADLTTTIMVCVDGAVPEICVEVDLFGQFTLEGDFTKDVHLHFFGSGQNVRLIVHDMYSDEVVTIRVKLHGDYGTVQVESRERGGHPSDPNSAEVKGVVTNWMGICPDLTFEVNGIVVNTNEQTLFKGGTCGDVADGVHVKVQGVLLTDTTPTEILAAEVKIDLDDDYSSDDASSEEGSEKVELCHRTGNGRYHLIEVSVNAVPAHMAHGDHYAEGGSCPV